MSDQLVIEGLRIARGERVVVRDVDIELHPGRVTALLGANGAGKSSFVLGVAGVLAPQAGSVRLGGVDLAGKPPHRIRASASPRSPRATACSPI